MKSSVLALLRMNVLIRPFGTSRIRNDNSVWLGAELNEYDRVSLLPGTCRLTYCPGRNARGRSACSVNVTVVAESRAILVSLPPCVPTSVLQAAADAGTRI